MASSSDIPPMLNFDVKLAQKKLTKTVRLNINLQTRKLTVISSKDEEVRDHQSIITIEKNSDNEKLLRVTYNGTMLKKPKASYKEKYSFRSTEERESCYHALHYIRQDPLLRKEVEDLHIFVGTWNMGNAPPPASLAPWVQKKNKSGKDFDIYAFSFQESTYSHNQDPKDKSPNNEKNQDKKQKAAGFVETQLSTLILSALGDGYTRLAYTSLWEIRLMVFVRTAHLPKITNLDKSSEATGIAHIAGNKGGIAISFKFNETSLCFVGSHLAAHQTKVSDRNSNYKEIMRGLKLGQAGLDIHNQFHHFFWCGDLNYRIDLPREEAVALATNKEFLPLLAQDQLLNEIGVKHCFFNFSEGKINFPPTYRYNRGDRTYSEEKGRVPSWCDRVLVKSFPNCPIAQEEYNCCDAITTSDHSPVYATYTVKTRLPPIPRRPDFCHIVITKLRGENLKSMDRNGLSDPYVVFTAPFLNGPKQTSIIKETLNPIWRNDEVPKLSPFVTDSDYLDNAHLYVIARDYDYGAHDDDMDRE